MSNSTGSFIPKSPVAGKGPSRRVRKIYIVSYIVYVFFGVTIITSLGMFAYTQYLGTQIAAAKETLVAKQESFNADALTDVTKLEARLNQAAAVFNSQVSLATVLRAVEEVVLNSVAITGFDYSDTAQTVTLKMSAELPDFNAAVYQRTVLSEHPVFASATIENVTYGSGGEGAGGEVVATGDKTLTFDIVVPLDTTVLGPEATYSPATTDAETQSTTATSSTGTTSDSTAASNVI